MIITRTPLRVSFLGGGSDFQEFFKDEIGYVFGSAINLFVYSAVIQHSELVDNRYKLTYRINESVDELNQIQHPLVREILKKFHVDKSGLHVATMADVPARTGLGSSSAFAVGLINAVSVLHSRTLSPNELATYAIEVERKILQEPGGWQDQCHSAFGGLNLISFKENSFQKEISITDADFKNYLSEKLILVAAGEARDSATHASITSTKLPSSEGKQIARELALIAKSTAETLATELTPKEKLIILADSMNRSWELKLQLGSIHSVEVTQVIQRGFSAGAISAKLCGAGGSGFVLFILGETSKESFSSNFLNSKVQEIRLHDQGSEVGPMHWN